MEVESEEKAPEPANLTRATFASPEPLRVKRADSRATTFSAGFSTASRSPHETELRRAAVEEIYFETALAKLQNLKFGAFLQRHAVADKHRSKMMDWMVDVLKTYKQREETVFRAFQLLDLFFAGAQRRVATDEIHLLGATCMLLASKQEEIKPMGIDLIVKNICRDKFTREQLLEKETEVLVTIGFRASYPTVYELSRCAFRLLQIADAEVRAFIENSALFVCKMCLFSYEILQQMSQADLVALSIMLALRLVEGIRRDSCLGGEIQQLTERFALSNESLTPKLYRVHEFTLQFGELMPHVRFLQQHYGFGSV